MGIKKHKKCQIGQKFKKKNLDPLMEEYQGRSTDFICFYCMLQLLFIPSSLVLKREYVKKTPKKASNWIEI